MPFPSLLSVTAVAVVVKLAGPVEGRITQNLEPTGGFGAGGFGMLVEQRQPDDSLVVVLACCFGHHRR